MKFIRQENILQHWTVPSNWVPIAVIIFSIVFVSLFFIYPNNTDFPMDDTYIHFVYAENLANTGMLYFNHANENGIGSTSILWVILLSAGYKAGLSLNFMAKFMGIASLIAVGVGLYILLRSIWPSTFALLGSFSVALSGNMIWYALSGMETVMFLAFGVLSLIAYHYRRWFWLGVTLGLMTLTRPEGLVLALTICCIELWYERKLSRGVITSAIITTLICGPWFIYLQLRTGHFMPTSAIGKQLSMTIAFQYVLENSETLSFLTRFPGITYIVLWILFPLEFILGGIALPPPRIAVGKFLNRPEYTVSIWALFLWVSVIFPLLAGAIKRLSISLKRPTHSQRALIALIGWVILHNICYMIILPSPGTASRYGAVNFILLWLTLIIGLQHFASYPRRRVWLAGGLLVIFLANLLYWNNVYDANLDHMKKVRIEAARFLQEQIPKEELCGVSDIGAMRYYSRREIIDMGGLIDSSAGQWFLNKASDQYLIENGVSCLILPGRAGSKDEGWLDLADILGLSTSPLFTMEQIAIYEIDRERWLLGYLPTSNYQASVVIYRLIPADPQSNLKN